MDYAIQVGGLTLKGIESVVIESSAEHLADTCVLTLPGQVRGQAYRIEDQVKRGDAVTVQLGYDGNLNTEFTGYVLRINPNTPMTIECEDSIFLFRKAIADKQFKKTTAVAIAQYVVDQIGSGMTLVTDLTGLPYDSFTIVHATGYEVLERLRSDYGVALYCEGSALHLHLTYTQITGAVAYDFARNVETSDDLQYVRADQVKRQVTVVGRGKKGQKIEVTVGEKGGDTATFQLPTVSDKNALEIRAKEALKVGARDGYRGSLHTWLTPVCAVGYSATLTDADYPERGGDYYVKGVKTSFSRQGGQRQIELGIQL